MSIQIGRLYRNIYNRRSVHIYILEVDRGLVKGISIKNNIKRDNEVQFYDLSDIMKHFELVEDD